MNPVVINLGCGHLSADPSNRFWWQFDVALCIRPCFVLVIDFPVKVGPKAPPKGKAKAAYLLRSKRLGRFLFFYGANYSYVGPEAPHNATQNPPRKGIRGPQAPNLIATIIGAQPQ